MRCPAGFVFGESLRRVVDALTPGGSEPARHWTRRSTSHRQNRFPCKFQSVQAACSQLVLSSSLDRDQDFRNSGTKEPPPTEPWPGPTPMSHGSGCPARQPMPWPATRTSSGDGSQHAVPIPRIRNPCLTDGRFRPMGLLSRRLTWCAADHSGSAMANERPGDPMMMIILAFLIRADR